MASSLPNWELPPRYQLTRKIGQGTYGSVCEANDLQTGEKVAIKSIKALFDQQVVATRMLREISIMRSLNHPTIIKIKKILMPSQPEFFNTVYIVMEHADSDLKKLARSSTFLDHTHVKFLMYQAICGCRYMHSANIFHRDIKPGNILINSDCSLKICDFGLSRSYQGLNKSFQNAANNQLESNEIAGRERDFKKVTKRILTDHVATRWYRAPEVILLEKEYGKEIDIWSLGCVFAELLGMISDNISQYLERAPLFPGKSCFPLSPDPSATNQRGGYPSSNNDQLNMIFRIIGTPSDDDCSFISDPRALNYVRSFPINEPVDLRELYPGSTPEELNLLLRLLTFSPINRITLDQALEHPYFRDIRRPELESLASVPADFIFDREEDLDMQTLRDLFRREIERYNDN
ncbi:unnamed protein product [Blepharisma stoltei]|uniref:Mitogen-activated protein kinase n=1 Tax=Blepharisma stoltei TaxID=1481888 RepID=A0AAU9IKU5_9CILI|nr:unnamed protein product [Blepharisma stoltei]